MDGDAPRKYKKRKWPFPTFSRDTVGPRSVDGTAAHTVRLRAPQNSLLDLVVLGSVDQVFSGAKLY
jgi:hypothetical protein